MDIRVIKPEQIDDTLREAWEAMRAASSELTSPVLTIDWAEAVARVRPDIEIVAAYDEGQPVAFLALQRVTKHVVECPGGLWTDAEAMITSQGAGLSAADLLRACGARRYPVRHLATLWNNPSCFNGYRDTASVVDLGSDPQQYWEERRAAGSFLKQADRKRRKLTREVGPVRFLWHDDSTQARESLLAWKNQQVVAQQGDLPMTEDWLISLVDGIATWDTPRMKGRLGALYAGDRLVALHLGVSAGDELTSWIPAHDISLNKYSPGLLCHIAMIEEAPRQGVSRIDLGRGENRLKASLANCEAPRYVGAIDLSPISRLRTAAWYAARDLARNTPGAMAIVSYCRSNVASLRSRSGA